MPSLRKMLNAVTARDHHDELFLKRRPAFGAGPSGVPNNQTPAQMVLERAMPMKEVPMPNDRPTTPFDEAITKYHQLQDKVAELEAKLADLDDKYVEACDSSRYWKGQADFFKQELEAAKVLASEAQVTITELATAGKSMSDLARRMTDIAMRVRPEASEEPDLKMPEFLRGAPEQHSTTLPENRLDYDKWADGEPRPQIHKNTGE